MYADDLIILSNTVTDMQLIMSLCSKVLGNLDMPINVNKCCCIRIGLRAEVPCAQLLLCKTPIPWVSDIKILGLHVCNGKRFNCDRSHVRSKFYRCVNSILGRIPPSGDASSLLTLIMSKSLPKLLYGVEATGVSMSELKSLSHAYNGIFAKIFNSWNKDIIAACQYYTGCLPIEYRCAALRFTFFNKANSKSSIELKQYFDVFHCHELNKIGQDYSFRICDSSAVIKDKCWAHLKNKLLGLQL
jgi:hypothetical protein